MHDDFAINYEKVTIIASIDQLCTVSLLSTSYGKRSSITF